MSSRRPRPSKRAGDCRPTARVRGKRAAHAPATLQTIVEHYVANVRERACERLAYYAEQPSLAHALEVVASWRDHDNRVEAHQRRLKRDVKREASERIRALDIRQAMTFEAVFQAVEQALGDIRGLGQLAIYDVSLRLAAVLGLPPERVYLHCGSRKGARALGIRSRERSLSVDRFPPELRRLHGWEIENLLCVYADELRDARAA